MKHKCSRCGEKIEDGMEPDGCRDLDCPLLRSVRHARVDDDSSFRLGRGVPDHMFDGYPPI